MGRDSKKIEAQRAELEEQFPGWEIWTSGGTWCAQPGPVLNAGSPEGLADLIRTSHASAGWGSPPLASWRSYRARLRRFRERETAVAAVWKHRRAEADARREARTADPVERLRARRGPARAGEAAAGGQAAGWGQAGPSQPGA